MLNGPVCIVFLSEVKINLVSFFEPALFHLPVCLHGIVLNYIIKYKDNITFCLPSYGIFMHKKFELFGPL
jgi:hypothetical protein